MAVKYYPLYLNLVDRSVLVVGAGAVATQKIPGLLAAGARLRVVAPAASAEIRAWAGAGRLEWRERPYETADLEGAALVFAAASDRAVHERVWREARERGLWVNVVDVPALCDFIAPSIVRQGELQIAVSTGGAAPALAKLLRRKLEAVLGPEYGELVRLAGAWRPEILKLPKEERRALWERFASDSFLELIRSEGAARAEARLKEWIHGKRPL